MKRRYTYFDIAGTKIREIEVGENWDGVLTFDKYNKLYVLLQSLEKKDSQENVLLTRQLRIYDIQSNTLLEQSSVVETKGNSKELIGEVMDKIEADGQENIYCLKASGEIEILDKKLKNIDMLQGRQCFDIELYEEDNILILGYGSNSEAYIEKISGKTQKSIWKKIYKQTDMPESIYYNPKSKALYCLTSQDIACLNDGGSIKGNIAGREQLGYLDNIFLFIVDEEENIYVQGRSNNTQKILKLTRTKNNEEDINNKKEIVVYSYYPFDSHASKNISNIIKKFEKRCPNISVRFIVHEELYDAENLSNLPYIQLLNTELLAGKGTGYYMWLLSCQRIYR